MPQKDRKRKRSRSKSGKKREKKNRSPGYYSSTKCRQSSSRSSSSSSSLTSESRSRSPSHYHYHVGQKFKHDKYKVVRHISDGTFGRVLLVIKNNKEYAMKIIKAQSSHIHSAKIEAEILREMNKSDLKYIVKLKESFDYGNNYIMIFERLGLSLSDLIRLNDHAPWPLKLIQAVLKQLLEAVSSLHNHNLTHTDLKPENIMFKYHSMVDDDLNPKLKWPKHNDIKIIDLGGAVYDNEEHDAMINTRQYRAPEVTLGCCAWGHASDVWGIGCIAMELYSGSLLFQTRKNEHEHIALIEKICQPIPKWMAKRTKKSLKHFFITKKSYLETNGTYFDIKAGDYSGSDFQRIKDWKNLKSLVREDDVEFFGLVSKLLKVDPDERISCKRALQDKFFKKDI